MDRHAIEQSSSEAVSLFYREHARTVVDWVIRLGGPDLCPEEVAQDVFVVALRRFGTFQDDGRPTAWLFGITRRVVANARRKAALRRFVGLLPAGHAADEPSAEDLLREHRQRRLVQELLDTLSSRHREVLVLCDLEERSGPEVAEMLQVSVGTVYSRLHHARARFATAMQARRGEVESLALALGPVAGEGA